MSVPAASYKEFQVILKHRKSLYEQDPGTWVAHIKGLDRFEGASSTAAGALRRLGSKLQTFKGRLK